MLTTLAGAVFANVTPFTPALEIDEDAFRSLIRDIASVDGIAGILCNSRIGEGATFSRQERRRCIRMASGEVEGRIPVLAAVEAYATEAVVQLVNDAQNVGAAAVMIYPPPINSWQATRNPEVAVAFFRAISNATDAPLIVFQDREGSPHGYAHDTLLEIVRENERIIAVSLDHGDDIARYARDVAAIRALERHVSIMTESSLGLFPPALPAPDGAITGLANIAPGEVVDLVRSAQAGDQLRLHQIEERLRPLALAVEGEPAFYRATYCKEAARALGRIPHAGLRPPALPISDTQAAALRQAMATAGLL